MMEQQTLFDQDRFLDEPTALESAFDEFHEANPEVWDLFKKYTFEVLRAGHKHYSSKAIVERIRWHTDIETKGGGFKVNNNFTQFYARLFMHTYPKHADFFRTRKVSGAPEVAT